MKGRNRGMKRRTNNLIVAIVLAVSVCRAGPVPPGVTLEVLNPLGEIEPLPTLGINPSIPDLNGKTIALMNNWKTGEVCLPGPFRRVVKEQIP